MPSALVVDDDRMHREDLKHLLLSDGFVVASAPHVQLRRPLPETWAVDVMFVAVGDDNGAHADAQRLVETVVAQSSPVRIWVVAPSQPAWLPAGVHWVRKPVTLATVQLLRQSWSDLLTDPTP